MKQFLIALLITLYTASVIKSFQFSPLSRSCKENTSVQSFIKSSNQSFNVRTQTGSELHGGFLDEIGNFMKRFTTKATASHILIKGGAEAANKLEDLKVEIEDSPEKFADAAAKFSECPSSRNGGNLGEFGPGAMVKEFDQVVFKEDLGVVHGPIKTQFGYHLIYINERNE